MSLQSDCCGASNIDFEDFGICPECWEHCEFIDDEDEENELDVTDYLIAE